MSSLSKYVLMATIEIEHEYYGSWPIPVELVPDATTKLNFQKIGVRHNREGNSWRVYCNTESVPYFKEVPFYRFLIQPLDDLFYYVTDREHSEAINSSLVAADRMMKSRIEIPSSSQEAKVKFKAISKFFEYILFAPKHTAKKMCMKLKKGDGAIEFEEMNILRWGDGREVIQFKSKNKVLLKKSNKYSFKLIEQSEFGENIVLQDVGGPKPQSLSLHEPYQAITAYHSL